MRLTSIFIGSLLMIIPFIGLSQKLNHDIAKFSDSLFNVGISEELIPGGVLTIVSSDSLFLSKGYGFANVEKKLMVDPSTTLFQLGSVGKAITAISLLQQVDKNNLKLNEDVNIYLTEWSVDKPGITPFHLLTHSAGFNDKVIGYFSNSYKDLDPLGEHLKENMPSTFQAPGININYSNYSYALAGHLVELVTDQEFKEYVNENIFNTLGMEQSTYTLPDDYEDLHQYARGYQTREHFTEIASYPRHAIPAGSILSTGTDMGLFMQHLLKRDSLLLSSSGFQLLFNQQFTNHPVLPGYTCGMEVYRIGEEDVVGKSGNVPGFLSAMVLFKERDLALFISVNTETDNFFESFFFALKDQFFTTPNIILPTSIENLHEYEGHYGNLRTSRSTIEEMFLLFMGHFRIYVDEEEGLLSCYHNGTWQSYGHLEKDVFQNLNHPSEFLVFQRDDKHRISNLYRSEIVGGLQIPVSYRKLPWLERPRFINDEYPFVLVFLMSYLLLPIFWVLTFVINSTTPKNIQINRLPHIYHVVALGFIFLFLWSVIGFFIPLLQDRESMLFGISSDMLNMRYVHYMMAIVSILLLFFSALLWKNRKGNLLMRIYYTLFSLAAISYILMLHRWHFLTIAT